MAQQEISSAAFGSAQLQSERFRILGIAAFLVTVIFISIVRIFLLRVVPLSPLLGWEFGLSGALIAYELWMFRRIDIALRENRVVPSWFWISSTVFETSIPAFFLAFLSSSGIDVAYRPLASPAVLTFFIFIILSTLRLTEWICYLCGFVASGSYIMAAWHLGYRPPVPGTSAPPAETAVGLYGVVLLASGLVAGMVARQIRQHVIAALREAETKRKLEAIQHDLQVARSIQQSLLPKETPEIAGFDIAGWNNPADDTSGDYFDWMTLPDGRVVTMLADVSGHGIGPALLAVCCHAYARATFNAQCELTAALTQINKSISHDVSLGRFITFVAAICGPGGSAAEILSAGHGPILVYSRADDRFTELSAQGLPLGILPMFTADAPASFHLQPGDLYLLITDGFFEWENDRGEQFGVKRLQDVIRQFRDESAAQIIARLHSAVISFSNGTRQEDDLTAVLVKRT
jgi:serine phosphatase RsbU (regulator of sigma subunit)